MNDKSSRKTSRREAMKILAAAGGATALANLPSKWTKPILDAGVLPAHAQTSVVAGVTCGADASFAATDVSTVITASITLVPARTGIQMHFNAVSTNGSNQYFPQSGDAATNASGVATAALQAGCSVTGDLIQVTWTFVNPLDGTGTCLQTLTSTADVPC